MRKKQDDWPIIYRVTTFKPLIYVFVNERMALGDSVSGRRSSYLTSHNDVNKSFKL